VLLAKLSVSVSVGSTGNRLARSAGAVLSFQLVRSLVSKTEAMKPGLQMAALSQGLLSGPSKDAGWAPPMAPSLGVPRGAPLVRQSVLLSWGGELERMLGPLSSAAAWGLM